MHVGREHQRRVMLR